MKVYLDRDDHYYYFIHNEDSFPHMDIELSEAEVYWVKETFDEMRKVQDFLGEIYRKNRG